MLPGDKIGRFEPEVPGEEDSGDSEDVELHWSVGFKPVGDENVITLSDDDDDDDEDENEEDVVEESDEENEKDEDDENEDEDEDEDEKE